MERAVCNTPAHFAPAARLLRLAMGLALWAAPARSAELAQTMVRIKSSVVGIGTFLKLSLLCVALPG